MKTLTTVLLFAGGLFVLGGEISDYCHQEVGENASISAIIAKSRSHDEVNSTNHETSEIGIERTSCYGTCPVYVFIAKNNGTFRYSGIEYVERTGEFTGTIDIGEFHRLAQFIQNSGYMDLESDYYRLTTDSATVFTTVVMKGKRKVVRNYANAGPTKLWAIEQLIDGLMHDAKWSSPISTTNWTPLFNGKDLTGWHHEGEATAVFVATNGVIHVEGGKGWLRTEKEYGDFILEAEWRGLETNYNSGVLIRAPLHPTPWTTNGWQVNLKQTAVGELLEGSRKAVLSTTTKPVNEWVKFRIEARGKKLTLSINGERAWEFNEFEAAPGYIGLQAEGKAVDFRNVRLQETGKKGSGATIPNSCYNNMLQIHGAKDQWSKENKKTINDIPTRKDIQPYLGRGIDGEWPVCPNGGTYSIGKLDESPKCSIDGPVFN